MKRFACRVTLFLLALLLPVCALGEDVVLRVAGLSDTRFFDEFAREHPGVTVSYVDEHHWSASSLISALTLRDATYDVMLLDTSNIDIAEVLDKGFALPMTGSEILDSFAASLYPALQDMVMRDGVICATPVYLFCLEGGYNPIAFESLGLDLPTTYGELAEMINRWPDQPADVLDEYEINMWTLNYRKWFLKMVLNGYMTHMEATGQELHFDTPLFRELMGLVDTLTTANDVEEERDVNYLMDTASDTLQQGYAWNCPLLDLAMDGRVIHTAYARLAIINPNTEHPEEALRFVERLVMGIDDRVRQTMVDAACMTPVEDPEYPQRLTDWKRERAALETKLAESDEADRPDVEQELARHERQLEWIENARWIISEESIPAFAQVFETLYFPKPDVLGKGDETGNAVSVTLQRRYLEGQLDMEQFIREMESKTQMLLQERGK